MCGICGIVTPDRAQREVRAETIIAMRDVMRHRGPDGEGLHVGAGVGLGHRRLSIVDVAHGAQPMTSGDGRYVIVYNGEVFNHPALKQELEADGVRYRTRCDTETVLHLHERYGHEAAHRLRGMFAIAIWDRRDRLLLLVRDRFGVKPLYYAHLEDGTLVFGSEIKAILASGLVPARLHRAALPDYLANHAPSGDETLYAGIRRLPPAHWLRWCDGRIAIGRYWDLPDPSVDGMLEGDDEALTREYLERFTEAVRLRLMSDVPLGVFLSGGIDSAAITAVMSGLVREPVQTFAVAFAEREANELAYARMVAERFGTRHREIVVSREEFFGALPRLVWHEDEPIAHPSSVALNFVARLAARHVKVVLTGEGSDEMLAGYNRYRVTAANVRLGGWWAHLPGAARSTARRLLDAAPRSQRMAQRLRRTFLYLPPDLDALYLDNFAVFDRAEQRALLAPALAEELAAVDPYAAFHAAFAARAGAPLLARLLYADSRSYLHELLMKQDQMSMAASIESRVPFLDHPLCEFVARLPERLKLRGATTKVILRRAMRGLLPDPILHRRKMGFPVPVGAWFRGPAGGLLDEFVTSPRARDRGLFQPEVVRRLVAEHRAGAASHGDQLWALVNFEIWQRIFLDGESPEAIATSTSLRRAA